MISPETLVSVFAAMPPEALMALEALVCFTAILGMLRLFGAAGLFVYIAVAVIGANIQVLKVVEFPLYGHPAALGTILFASTYFAVDLLAEHYGRAAAQRGVMIGFAAFLLWTVLMTITLGYAPLTPAQAGEDMAWALPTQDHLAALFLPVPALFAASMISYLASQFADVWLFQRIRSATDGRHLWLRTNGSTAISALLDTIVFNVLAWVVFAAQPVDWHTLVYTYILSTYWMRFLVSVSDTPFMYLSRYALPRRRDALA